jgi:uncharacterized protein YwlG (UPF0340 family)
LAAGHQALHFTSADVRGFGGKVLHVAANATQKLSEPVEVYLAEEHVAQEWGISIGNILKQMHGMKEVQ